MLEPIRSLQVKIDTNTVGRLARTPEGLIVFEYSPEFVTEGFSISPFYLPLRPGLFTASSEPFDGNFGVFNDSLPDGWGNLLLDRYLMSQGIQSRSLSVLDRLSLVGSSGMGALQYFPEQHIDYAEHETDLNFLAQEVKKVISETEYSEYLNLLLERAGSSGGARPKVLILDDDRSWIVKFPAALDPPDIGTIEFEYSRVARTCGLNVPETRLFEDQYYGIQRFDRIQGRRVHTLTASGLLNASHRYPSLDYAELIKASFALTRDINDSYRLFRQMVFNVLTGVRDDHSKNFSFLRMEDGWQLSPAYDLVPSVGFNGNHTTTIAGQGNPTRKDLFSAGIQAGLVEKKLIEIFDEVHGNCASIRLQTW